MKRRDTADAPGTLLLAVKSAATLQALNAALKDEHEVLFARDGKTALDIVAGQEPDLILLDPEPDGLAICKSLKKSPSTRQMPVVFVTEPGAGTDEAAAIEAGVADFIARPIGDDALRARVRLQRIVADRTGDEIGHAGLDRRGFIRAGTRLGH